MKDYQTTQRNKNLKLSPTGELTDYLMYASKQAGFDFSSDLDLRGKYYRYLIEGSFPCEVDRGNALLKINTRDVLVRALPGCSSNGENRILQTELTLSIPRDGSIGGQVVDSPHNILGLWEKRGTSSEEKYFARGNSNRWYNSQSPVPEVRGAINRLVQADESCRQTHEKGNDSLLYQLVSCPSFFSLCTYQGDPKQLPVGFNDEIRNNRGRLAEIER